MTKITSWFSFLLLLVLGSALHGHALRAEDTQNAPGDPTGELVAVEDEMATSTKTQGAIVRRMVEAIRAQEEASGKLVELAHVAGEQEQALALATRKLDALQADNAKALLALASKREAMAKLLAGLQRLEQNPPPALVVSPGDVLQALRGAMMFGAVIPDLRRETDELRAALSGVERIKTALEAEKARRQGTLQALEKTRADIASLVRERQEAAGALVQELSAAREKSMALAARARDLEDLVAALEQAKAADALAKARQETEAKAREEALAEAQAQDLAQALAEAQQKVAQQPKMRFSDAKGKLGFPVQGRMLRHPDGNRGGNGGMPGIFMIAERQGQVVTPTDGIIEFAGKFRSYDQVVIINPGEGYLVLLAGMNQITVSQGQSVRAGEPVGIMGDKPSAVLLASDLSEDLTLTNAPVLYVEFRKKNEPVDPTPWWHNQLKEAKK